MANIQSLRSYLVSLGFPSQRHPIKPIQQRHSIRCTGGSNKHKEHFR